MFYKIGRAIARLGNPQRERYLDRLRELGRPAGVTWLRNVLRENKVGRISDLPDATISTLLTQLEAA